MSTKKKGYAKKGIKQLSSLGCSEPGRSDYFRIHFQRYEKKNLFVEWQNNMERVPLIIHISGASGSGKTVLGRRLKDKFQSKIIVKDLDDLREEFCKEFYGSQKWTHIDEEEYQNYIDEFVSGKRRPIVFVGLNDNMFGKDKRRYYDVHSKYNFYIDLDDEVVIQQKCKRLLNGIQQDKVAMDALVHNNAMFIKRFSEMVLDACDAKKIVKMNAAWKRSYENQGYKIRSRERIFESVVKILTAKLKRMKSV